MVGTTTREGRAERWRFYNVVALAILAVSTAQLASTTESAAQVVVKPTVKMTAIKTSPKVAKPSEQQEADQLNAKWLADHSAAEAAANAQPAAQPLAVAAPAAAATTVNVAPAPAVAGPGEEDKFAHVPQFGAPVTVGSRALVPGSLSLVKASTTAAFTSVPGGSSLASYKEVTQAFSGFAPGGAKIEMVKGQTADGATRLLYASIGDGKNKQSFWWYAPSDQPDGWFDDKGARLGGTVLADPKPDARISSPFGTRRYYGRMTSTAFHNGIDFESKMGEPIHAAADGIVNHANWYYNYGRTVKISHADNFETLYAHMSRIESGLAPGTAVKKGDIIGYVGSTGRSTGPHLHFSAIVNGQFVDPAQYLSESGNGQLTANALVSYRQWQQNIRVAAEPKRSSSSVPQGLHGADEHQQTPAWSTSPFTTKTATAGRL